MLGFLAAMGSMLSFGSGGVLAKRAIETLGRRKAIVYFYATLVLLLLAGTMALQVRFEFPGELLGIYIAQITIGALGIIAFYKAMEQGKISILAPLGRVYVLIVIVLGVLVFGEILSFMQVIGSLLIIISGIVIAFEDGKKLKIEAGTKYVLLAIACWGFYYTFLKTFVTALGAYPATVVTECGVASIVIAYYVARRTELKLPSAYDARYTIANGISLFLAAFLYNISIENIGIALTAAIVSGAPIITAVLSYFILKEKLDTRKYAAIVLMVAGLIMVLAF